MKKGLIYSKLALIVLIVVLINLIGKEVYFRLDFTSDQRYTLSDATKQVLHNIDDAVTITAYFSENVPAQLEVIKQDFRDLLEEYESRSDGKVVFRFINPNESEQMEREAQSQGISPLMINVREQDRVEQMRAYMGAVIRYDEQVEIIPAIQGISGVEYELTSAIQKLSVQDKPKVAWITGHGEPSIRAIPQLQERLSVLYDLEPYTITDTMDIPSFYRALIMMAPQDTVPYIHLAKIDAYLRNGGGLVLGYGKQQPNMQQRFIMPGPELGIKPWLAEKGVDLQDKLIRDVQCVPIQIQDGGSFLGIPMSRQVQFPFFPIVSNFAEHPVVEGLESMVLTFVNGIAISEADTGITHVPLAFSSDQSSLADLPAFVDFDEQYTAADFPESNLMMAVALNGSVGGGGQGRMVFIASNDFAVNGEPGNPQMPQQQQQQQRPVQEDNVDFVANAVDWMSNDTGLSQLRTKGVSSRPLDPVEDTTRNTIKVFNMFAPLVLIGVVIFIQRRRRARQKRKWKEGIY